MRALFTSLAVLGVVQCALAAEPAATPPAPAAKKRPEKMWTRTGPLGEAPRRTTDAYPLSDQQNQGRWVKYAPMSDEFDGQRAGPEEMDPRHALVEGPAAGAVQRRERHRRRTASCISHAEGEAVARVGQARLQGLHVPPALHANESASSYGYFEVKAKPMNSGGSSSFWFQEGDWKGPPRPVTEIDVFEIGGKAKGFEHKYNMTLHVSEPPDGEEALERAAALGRPLAAGRRLPRLRPGLGTDELKYYVDGVLVRSVENTHWHQPLVPDLRQRDDAQLVRDAQRQGPAFDVQRGVRAGVEAGGREEIEAKYTCEFVCCLADICLRRTDLSSAAKVFRHSTDDADCFDAHSHYLSDKADNVLRVVGLVGVGADAAPLILANAVLVDDPFQCACGCPGDTRRPPAECRPM